MSNISNYTGKFRLNNNAGAQDQNLGRAVRKPRETSACTRCRFAKLKCDKGRPCSCCVRTDGGSSCSYSMVTKDRHESRNSAQERLQRLESMVAQLLQNQKTTTITVVQPQSPTDLAVEPGRSASQALSHDTDSKYPTVLEDVMDSLNELKLTLPTMEVELEESLELEESMRESERIFASSSKYSMDQILFKYLPDRRECDALLSAYYQGNVFLHPAVCFALLKSPCGR